MPHSIGFSSIALIVGLAHARNDTVVNGWVPEPSGRGTWSILWSSLVTVFICTWSVLHLPVRKEGRWRSFLRKFTWMLGAVLAPEFILTCSLEDFIRARNYLRVLVQYGGSEWTMAHAHFAMDDGFKISYTDGRSDVCSLKDIIGFMEKGEISHPPISREELLSRSDSNWLLKLIALLQILWFALQCLLRVIQHMQVTPLELLVIAFVFCSMFTYIFSWSKPQNVEYTISIPRIASPSYDTTTILAESQAESQSHQENDQPFSGPKIVQTLSFRKSDARRSSPGTNGFECESSQSSLISRWFFDEDAFLGMVLVTMLLMILFGAIHFSAWNSPFPSPAEQLSWRVCALITTSIPALLGGISACLYYFDGFPFAEPLHVTIVATYAAARLTLIVLAFTALRAQPSDVYQTVNLTQYLPNFAA